MSSKGRCRPFRASAPSGEIGRNASCVCHPGTASAKSCPAARQQSILAGLRHLTCLTLAVNQNQDRQLLGHRTFPEVYRFGHHHPRSVAALRCVELPTWPQKRGIRQWCRDRASADTVCKRTDGASPMVKWAGPLEAPHCQGAAGAAPRKAKDSRVVLYCATRSVYDPFLESKESLWKVRRRLKRHVAPRQAFIRRRPGRRSHPS